MIGCDVSGQTPHHAECSSCGRGHSVDQTADQKGGVAYDVIQKQRGHLQNEGFATLPTYVT